MKIRMNSHIVNRIIAHLDDLDHGRGVTYNRTQLQEVATAFAKFDGLDDKDIVRHFHSLGQKINGIKTLRLMLDYSLADAKNLYERLAEEIDREPPKVDVNLLKHMLTYFVSQSTTSSFNSIVGDLRFFLNNFDKPETDHSPNKFYSDNELLAKGTDPMTILLYSQARDHFIHRLPRHQTLGEILGDALK